MSISLILTFQIAFQFLLNEESKSIQVEKRKRTCSLHNMYNHIYTIVSKLYTIQIQKSKSLRVQVFFYPNFIRKLSYTVFFFPLV